MSPTSVTVVLLPFVPVMAMTGALKKPDANSSSPMTRTPRRRAACSDSMRDGTPGLITTTSASSSADS